MWARRAAWGLGLCVAAGLGLSDGAGAQTAEAARAAVPFLPLPGCPAKAGALAPASGARVTLPVALRLQVDATDVAHRRLQVRESLRVKPGPLRLYFPRWIPGHHGPTNEVKRLAGLRISAGGQRLDWRRDADDAHGFDVDVPAGQTALELQFDVLLPLQGDTADAWLQDGFVNLQWQATMLYPSDVPVSALGVDVQLRLPPGLRMSSALDLVGCEGDALRFAPVSLETLLDSPVFAARHARRYVLDDRADAPVTLDVFAETEAPLQAGEPALRAHRAMVEQADRLFGARHFRHYRTLLAIDDELEFGLEHHESSENGVKRGYFSDWDHTSLLRYVVPHEFVHSWNGKFRRPRDLWAPNFHQPTRNTLLWVYEGMTQYFGLVLGARSGLQDGAVTREELARVTAWGLQRPSQRWRSLQDTVADEIISGRRTRQDWPSYQGFEDYYDEGALMWLELDATLRETSGGTRSLDDFARAFFGVEPGRVAPLLYDFDDVVRTLQSVQPGDWAAWLRSRLDSVGPERVERALARTGWRLGWSAAPTPLAEQAEKLWGGADFMYSLGLRVNGKDRRLGAVLWDGPAFRAGLAPGAELLAVNGRAYSAERLREITAATRDGGPPVELLVREGEVFRSVRLDWQGGLRYPVLERVDGTEDRLGAILAPR